MEKTRQYLVKAAKDGQITLRRNYKRTAPSLAIMVSRYGHVKQFARMKNTLGKLRTQANHVYRDIVQQLNQVTSAQQAKLEHTLHLAQRILTQRPQDSAKLYALHAPKVECIAKGRARKRYEFGVKVSIVTTQKEELVLFYALFLLLFKPFVDEIILN